MNNFAVLQAVGRPETYVDCARAESYALSDPRAACIISHRAAGHSREVQRLPDRLN